MGTPLMGLVALSTVLQLPTAQIRGFVRDVDTGEPIPGATVMLAEPGRGGLTDALGGYALTGVPPGPQHLTVGSIGYGTRTVHALVPSQGTLHLDVYLRSAPIPLPGLDIVPPVPVAQSEPDDARVLHGRAVSAAAMRSSPLLAEPDAFAALVGGEVGADPEAPAGLHVRGGAADQVRYALDGIPVLDPLHAAGLFSAWSPDALSGVALDPTPASGSVFGGLSGVVTGRIREPGVRAGGAGSFSSTSGSVSAHGPLGGSAGSGYVLAVRTGFPGGMPPKGEPSYLAGEAGDALAKVTLPLADGRLSLLAYGAESEVATPATPPGAEAGVASANTFDWSTETVGAAWSAPERAGAPSVRVWRASAGSSSGWGVPESRALLGAMRSHAGIQGEVGGGAPGSEWRAGIGLSRIAARYAGGLVEGDRARFFASVYGQRRARLTRSWWTSVSASVIRGSSTLFAPAAELAWGGPGAWSASLRLARTHQLTQSLRNPESAAARIFPAEPSLIAGVDGVPVPRSDDAGLAVAWTPRPGARLGASGYARALYDVLLVAPQNRGPFATESPSVGRGSVQGATLEAALAGARYGAVASLGVQRVRLRAPGGEYTPSWGPARVLDVGVVAHPSAAWSLRVGVSAAGGRRASDLAGPFEWEACNVLDGGCEFAGSPSTEGEPGGRRLPGYLRLDVGGRRHWHVALAGRQTLLGVFATVTNVLGRDNVLAYVREEPGGALAPIGMRPTLPLVVGLDWRF